MNTMNGKTATFGARKGHSGLRAFLGIMALAALLVTTADIARAGAPTLPAGGASTGVPLTSSKKPAAPPIAYGTPADIYRQASVPLPQLPGPPIGGTVTVVRPTFSKR